MSSNEDKIKRILGQTNYSEEVAKEKLIAFEGDYIKVIKDFLGITEKKKQNITSINQEMYKQFRSKLYVPLENFPGYKPNSGIE